MPLKHLTPSQWDAVDAGTPDQDTRDHLVSCEECRAVVPESRALLIGLRRPGHSQKPGQPLPADHPAAEDLAAYGDGVLFGAGARSIEEHLEHCSDCRDDIIVMRDVATAGDLKETVSPEIRDQLLERLSRAPQPERVTSLGDWLVKVSRGVGAVFSPLASEKIAAAAAVMMALKSAEIGHERLTGERSKLEHALKHAREEAEQARMAMDRATARMRDLWLQVEEMAREHLAQAAAVAAARAEADKVAAMMPDDPVGPLLELRAADVRLRVEASRHERPDVFTATVLTQAGDPVPGVSLEVRSPNGESTLRTTDEHGHASFSLQRGESRLRLLRHGVWELQLARQS
jgi:hypothetical protein